MPETELRTQRLVLRPFRSCDVDDALAYRNDGEFARYLPNIPQPFTREDAEKFVELNMSEAWDKSPTFAVVLNETVIGTVNFEIDTSTQSAMVGYAIGRKWWGQGLAVEAVRAAMTWAAKSFRLVRIWASTDARNTRSIRLMERLGMKQEPVQREDQVVFASKFPATSS